jgi:HEPN domain-containing protein
LSRNVANVLWTKAFHDYNAAEKLKDVDPEIVGDQVFGLLLQQSVEKAVKSLILRANLSYDRTHDLHHLFKILSKKMVIPAEFEPLEGLTMFASHEKYEAPISQTLLDRRGLLRGVKKFLDWASQHQDR